MENTTSLKVKWNFRKKKKKEVEAKQEHHQHYQGGGISRAAIQRKRLKSKEPGKYADYLAKERSRSSLKYTATNSLPAKQREQRRRQCRERKRKSRLNQKQQQQQIQEAEQQSSEAEPHSQQSSTNQNTRKKIRDMIEEERRAYFRQKKKEYRNRKKRENQDNVLEDKTPKTEPGQGKETFLENLSLLKRCTVSLDSNISHD